MGPERKDRPGQCAHHHGHTRAWGGARCVYRVLRAVRTRWDAAAPVQECMQLLPKTMYKNGFYRLMDKRY